ncbi:MAG: putative N-acetylmannosamine-6-phosphate 2-epimerase [Fimbriimonadaceae bacterium]|nr:putative N-acetylmannosamine-6-phosphate 2-epimerase [Fimbriimonadaceae bacterium]
MSFFTDLRGLIVSCQAEPDSPLYGPAFMAGFAACAERAGAVAVRIRSGADVAAVRAAVRLPVIGLTKRWVPGYDVYITPAEADADELAAAGAHAIALDATARQRPDGATLEGLISYVREQLALPVMADVSTFAEGVRAARLGCEAVSTTLSGYTAKSPRQDGPDLTLVARLVEVLDIPVIAEGRVHTPELAGAALAVGARAVVVGSAITEPIRLTQRFVAAVSHRS